MKYCEVYATDSHFNDHLIGSIFIEDGEVKCKPADNKTLGMIVNNRVRRYPHDITDFDKGKGWVTKSEPEVFLESAHHQYQSAYKRVGPVQVKKED